MRCVAGAGLWMLVGCNQIFGIHKTEPYDARPDVIPDLPYVKLTWQVADVLPSGDPDPVLVDAPIDPAPHVRYSALGQPLQDTTYSPADGAVIVAREFFTAMPDGGLPTWRLEYTLSGGVPHEVQWSPEDKHGQLTVPLFGRAARNPVPTGGGYAFTPDLAPASFQSPHIFTTGQWSEGVIPAYDPSNGAAIDYDFFNAAAMSGGRARPEPALGDRAFLIDYAFDGGCRHAIGSARLDSSAIQPGMHSVTPATWDAATRPVSSQVVDLITKGRFLTALGTLHDNPNVPDVISGTLSLGIAANINMPPLTGVPPAAVLTTSTDLPAPVMITVLQCPYDATSQPKTAQPADLDRFSRLLNVQLVSKRQVLGVSLASGMETALASPSSENFKLTFPAGIPTQITLATPTNPALALDGADEQLDIGPAAGPLTLAFVPDIVGDSADYYDVTLYQLDASTLVAKRIYTVTAPQVAIDGAVLSAGVTYVFQIRSFKGHPDARSGDFRPVSFPYGSAIVFTRTFHTS
ncbi:MAG: hypothetical protein ABIY55_00640 [Kofleriaceae bacterium]